MEKLIRNLAGRTDRRGFLKRVGAVGLGLGAAAGGLLGPRIAEASGCDAASTGGCANRAKGARCPNPLNGLGTCYIPNGIGTTCQCSSTIEVGGMSRDAQLGAQPSSAAGSSGGNDGAMVGGAAAASAAAIAAIAGLYAKRRTRR